MLTTVPSWVMSLLALFGYVFMASGCENGDGRVHAGGFERWGFVAHERGGSVYRLAVGRAGSREGTGGYKTVYGNEYLLLGSFYYDLPPGALVLIDGRTNQMLVLRGAPTKALSEFYLQPTREEGDVAKALRRLGETLGEKPVIDFIDMMISDTPVAIRESEEVCPAQRYRPSK